MSKVKTKVSTGAMWANHDPSGKVELPSHDHDEVRQKMLYFDINGHKGAGA
jgi:hypothetical protein